MTDTIIEVKIHTARFEAISQMTALVEAAMNKHHEEMKDKDGCPTFSWFIRRVEPEFVVNNREERQRL